MYSKTCKSYHRLTTTLLFIIVAFSSMGGERSIFGEDTLAIFVY